MEDRWTMPSESTRPSEVLINGSSDLFIRPFMQMNTMTYLNKLIVNMAEVTLTLLLSKDPAGSPIKYCAFC